MIKNTYLKNLLTQDNDKIEENNSIFILLGAISSIAAFCPKNYKNEYKIDDFIDELNNESTEISQSLSIIYGIPTVKIEYYLEKTSDKNYKINGNESIFRILTKEEESNSFLTNIFRTSVPLGIYEKSKKSFGGGDISLEERATRMIENRSYKLSAYKFSNDNLPIILGFSKSIIDKYSTSDTGKRIIFEFALKHKIELNNINFCVSLVALLEKENIAYSILTEMIDIIIKTFTETDYFKNISTGDKKSILLEIFNLKFLKENSFWHEIVNYSAKEFQYNANIDLSYLEELEEVSKKYISLKKEILEIINE